VSSPTPTLPLQLPDEDRLALIVLAVAQSLVLLLLHKAIDHALWPATDPRWLHAAYTAALGAPLFIYLGAVRWRDRANAYAAPALLLLGLAGWHTGWLGSSPLAVRGSGEFVPVLACTGFIALFIGAFYFRSQRECGRFAYEGLLDHSWRNALTLGFLGLFVGAFWLLLALWAQLFKLIEIDFFAELFERPGFVYPITGLVVGWGLGLIRARVGMIATVRHLCEALARALLPLVAFILVIFLAALPFTGVEALWKTRMAATLLLGLAAVLLFFVNAVVADQDGLTMHPLLRRLVLLALLLLPINPLLAGWAMWLRIDQYGWTVDRLWGVVVLGFAFAFSVGYAAVLVRRRALVVAELRHLNTALGLALATVLFAANTPLLEFRRIAAADQVARLESGRTAAADFDARYLRFELGRYGIERLQALQASELAKRQPDLAATIADALDAGRWSDRRTTDRTDLAALRARFDLLPGTALEDELLLLFGKADSPARHCFEPGVPRSTAGAFRHRGRDHLALFAARAYPPGTVWRRDESGWRHLGALRRFGCPNDGEQHIDHGAALELVDGDFVVLRNGQCLYQVEPESDALVLAPRGP